MVACTSTCIIWLPTFFCSNHGINLDIQWVPRSQNEKADYLSKIIDYDDWAVVPQIFHNQRPSGMAVGVPIPSTVLPRFTTIKFLDFSLGFGTRVFSGVEAFFKFGRAKIVGW